MERDILKSDIKLICVIAESSPEEIRAAQQKVHSSNPNATLRKSFGISAPNQDGGIFFTKLHMAGGIG